MSIRLSAGKVRRIYHFITPIDVGTTWRRCADCSTWPGAVTRRGWKSPSPVGLKRMRGSWV